MQHSTGWGRLSSIARHWPLAPLGLAIVAPIAACSSTGTGGAVQDGGTIASGGSVGAGGSVGSGGSGGSGGASAGTTHVEFTTQGSFCDQGECGPPNPIAIKDPAGKFLRTSLGFGSCETPCATCQPQPCPGFACQQRGYAIATAKLDWDGRYYENGTCGTGTACYWERYASPGSFTAVMCATPGTLTGQDAGAPQCTASGPRKCTDVPFNYPGASAIGTLQ